MGRGNRPAVALEHRNLTGWVIDDFYANHELFTPHYIRAMQQRAKAINPRLRFLPLMYFPEVTRSFAEQYGPVIDGIVVAYPNNSQEIRDARGIMNGELTAAPGSLGCPSHTQTEAGDFASASTMIEREGNADLKIRFREVDDFVGPTAGYQFKQVLVDGDVVWEQDCAGGGRKSQQVEVDLSPHVPAKSKGTLTFRLYDRKGVSNFGLGWKVSDLRVEGGRSEANLSKPEAWRVETHGPLEAGFGGGLRGKSPVRKVPMIVMTAGQTSEFKLRHGEPASAERMAEWVKMCLEEYERKNCDGVVTYALEKEEGSKVFEFTKELFRRK